MPFCGRGLPSLLLYRNTQENLGPAMVSFLSVCVSVDSSLIATQTVCILPMKGDTPSIHCPQYRHLLSVPYHHTERYIRILTSRYEPFPLQWADIEFVRRKRNPPFTLSTSAIRLSFRRTASYISMWTTPLAARFWHHLSTTLAAAELDRRTIVFALLLSQLPPVLSAGGEGDLKPTVQPFDGVVSSFTPWLIAFTALIAWKKPEVCALINGASPRPVADDPDNPTISERKKIKAWNLLNVQLYGALVSYVIPTIQASLHVNAIHDGVAALRYLQSRYGSQSTGDRAEATARLQRTHIDARAKISPEDVTRQYNEMSLAAADIVASNGTRPDDSLMISMFENALPPSYGPIRQMMRYAKHLTFDSYYNDLLTQVKAELRSSEFHSVGAFSTTYSKGKGNTGSKGKGKGKGGGSKGRWQPGRGGRGGMSQSDSYSTSYQNPCFNCLATDHTRDVCPKAPTRCTHCGWNHASELCPLGPGGTLRDNLTPAAWDILERQSQRPHRNNSNGKRPLERGAYSSRTSQTSTSDDAPATDDVLQLQLQAYLLGKKSASKSTASDVNPSDSVSVVGSHTGSVHIAKRAAASSSRPDLDEIDEFLAQFKPGAHMVYAAGSHLPPSAQLQSRGMVVYIDSQATNFVVPSAEHLDEVTDPSPTTMVDTTNGSVKPSAIGTLRFSIFDDSGSWHNFIVKDVWVIESCDRILYSQRQMCELGVIHRLDEGMLILPNGAQKSVSKNTYTVEIIITSSDDTRAYSTSSLPLLRSKANSRGRGADTTSNVPQQILWQRLGFPSRHIWAHATEMIVDHGIPSTQHLKWDFPTPDAVASARAKVLPFHTSREADSLPAPGSYIYMDFAGPMVPSYPHKFTHYCGAVDAGSGYSRIVPCHSPSKEIAQQCLELLLADLRTLMGLSHRLTPQVITTDQGSQFMAHQFRDFLSQEQIKHWPSVVYKPQQNAIVERMWGTRFGMARTLLKYANLGPSFHPFALQTSNWIGNRLPQSSRGNLSAWFILSKLYASVAYLRSFGCLTRITIPLSHRVGDRHFADRGTMGIYLGPSEVSPGCVVYSPSLRKFFTSRDIICYEDIHPGVKGVDSAWAALPDEPIVDSSKHGDTSSRYDVSVNDNDSSIPAALTQATDPPMIIAESHTLDEPTDDTPIVHVDSDLHAPILEPNVEPTDDVAPAPPQKIRKVDQGSVDDPSSRNFQRQLPLRSTRYKGGYFVNPSEATTAEAVHNYLLRLHESMGSHNPYCLMVYESVVSGTSRALVVTSTSDMGDLVIPMSYEQACSSRESSYWLEAINREINGLVQLGTFAYVKLADLPPGSNVMRCHMVFTVKRLEDGSIEKFKCRLVANGNTQRWGVDFDRVFSTVAKISTLRLALVLAAMMDYNLSSIDIRQAYLQAELHEDLYMKMPPGLPDTDAEGNKLVVKLLKSLYGLKQAGREWNHLLTTELCTWGLRQSSIDPCLFTFRSGSSLLWVIVWVDDCVIVDNDPQLRDEFVRDLSRRFPVEDKSDLSWVLHVHVIRDRRKRTISLSQQLYVRDLLLKYGSLLEGLSRRFDSPCDAHIAFSADQCPAADSVEHAQMDKHRSDYMSLVGAFLWLANVSRPELSYIAGQLARFVSNPGMIHYRAALRVLLYLKGSESNSLSYTPTQSSGLVCFVDADWSTRFSTSGGVLCYGGCPVHWFSRTQRSVSMSSTESEYFATCVAAREVMFLRDLVSDFGFSCSGPTCIYSDNRGVIDLSLDPVSFKKTKHILRSAEFVRDLVMRKVIFLQWISGKDNPADIFTKAVELVVFRKLLRLLSDMLGVIKV